MTTDKLLLKEMNINNWIFVNSINRCIYGCKKFKEKLYIGNKFKRLNPLYLFHLQSTHGFPAIMFINHLANELYNNEKDRNKMINFYKDYDI